ncbi:hypothetical protein BU23DRAFT_601957 [Bimuria novae-zelandiae CBS 107.79]|uniref:Cora-domain-containing protein n=1 Tax=Bimuria novae-zelandiae CBS 107.79 TaxID=1447943 RepID=A0A6A5UV21_9PLEO|nr:hypothetical protein BU23DRAFT_601957 [Bimuria novae-zelandiae CBS 107.79]
MAHNRHGGTKAKMDWDWRYWPSTPITPAIGDISAVLGHSNHPELEDPQSIVWGLAQCEGMTEATAVIDVLDIVGTDVTWKHGLEDAELESMVAVITKRKLAASSLAKRSFSVFFLNTLRSREGWLPGNFSFSAHTLRTLQKAGLSSMVLDAIFTKSGYGSKMRNQCSTQREVTGELKSFEVCYRYICGWEAGISFTQFLRTQYQTVYFCINYPPAALCRLRVKLEKRVQIAYRDFFLDALSADESLRAWEIDIGVRREQLFDYERKYDVEVMNLDVTTRELHRLSKDWNSLGQDCQDQALQLDFLASTYGKYLETMNEVQCPWEVDKSYDMRESFEVLKSQCNNYYRWTIAHRERTNIRINLLFHLSAQQEARTSKEIAEFSARIAEQTQRDSASMITIAAVTMLFLPGSFISAVLSTIFFDYGEDSLRISKEWWILPATAIPTTLIVFAIWLVWRWQRVQKQNVARQGR